MMYLCVELVRQFYDEVRTFRITGQGGEGGAFTEFSNAGIKDQVTAQGFAGPEEGEQPLFRRPIFDIKVRAEKRNPFSQMSMNETAKELYRLGVFQPEKAQESMLMLEMMEFEGIDAVREKVATGQTLLTVCKKMGEQLDKMAALVGSESTAAGGGNRETSEWPQLGILKGAPPTAQNPLVATGKKPLPATGTLASALQDAQLATMTPYGERLAKRALPDMAQVQKGLTSGGGA